MSSGRLRHVLVIEKPVVTDGSLGSEKSWSEFATVRGAIDSSGSKQVVSAQQLNSEVIGVITIRFVAGITDKMRVNLNGEYFYITRPYCPDGRNRYLKIPYTLGPK